MKDLMLIGGIIVVAIISFAGAIIGAIVGSIAGCVGGALIIPMMLLDGRGLNINASDITNGPLDQI